MHKLVSVKKKQKKNCPSCNGIGNEDDDNKLKVISLVIGNVYGAIIIHTINIMLVCQS